jgi:arylsulfatase A-like enzyme
MSDDHAPTAVSAYSSRLIETAHIDRLAKEGIMFHNAFVTNAICGPSRAVILTGIHSHLNGVKDNHTSFNPEQTTFPGLLRAAGYQTALVGKWHLQSQPANFDYWNVLPGQGDYYNPAFINNGKDTIYEGYVTDITTDLALEWLKGRKKSAPFCLMVHHKAPHRNWMPDLQYLDSLEEEKFPVPGNYHEDISKRPSLKDQELTVREHMDFQLDLKIPCDTCPVAKVNSWAPEAYKKRVGRMNATQRALWEDGYASEQAQFFKGGLKGKALDEWKLQRYLEDYLRCILSVDQSVGKILSYLDESGLAENTIVIYTSDQGFFLGEHGLFDKRYMFEESMRTPLLIRYPGDIDPGISSRKLVQNLDLAPTFLDVAGVAIPKEMQGRSLKQLFSEPAPVEWRDALYYHFYESGWGVLKHEGIRTERHKLIRYYGEDEFWELFDLRTDPEEMFNLYGEKLYQELEEELTIKLDSLKQHYRVTEE